MDAKEEADAVQQEAILDELVYPGTVEYGFRTKKNEMLAIYSITDLGIDYKKAKVEYRYQPEKLLLIKLLAVKELARLHNLGYHHNDLKAANILVIKDSNGEPSEVRLMDFGLTQKAGEVCQHPVDTLQNCRHYPPELRDVNIDENVRTTTVKGEMYMLGNKQYGLDIPACNHRDPDRRPTPEQACIAMCRDLVRTVRGRALFLLHNSKAKPPEAYTPLRRIDTLEFKAAIVQEYKNTWRQYGMASTDKSGEIIKLVERCETVQGVIALLEERARKRRWGGHRRTIAALAFARRLAAESPSLSTYDK